MIINRRTFIATGASFGALTLAACSSDPVSKAEQQSSSSKTDTTTPAASTTDTTTTASTTPAADIQFYDGKPVPPIGKDPLLNPDGVKDRPIGAKNAKVIVIEYSSPTCPHCAAFALDVYPAFKKKYIDTGKITYILRPFVRNVLDAVVFMLADAAAPKDYVNVIETYFKTMNTWATSSKPRDEIEKIALQLGFTKNSFEAALTNQTLFDGLDKLRTQALDKFDVTGTPTFFINDKKYAGEHSLEQFSAAIDPLLA